MAGRKGGPRSQAVRGGSDWLESATLYQPLSYCEALSHLLAWLDRPVAWLGTSLGGICGMILAATQNSPIQKLILNDIGPFIPAAALARIADYITPPEAEFPDLAALETHLRTTQHGFAPMSDADWRAMALHSSRPGPKGGVLLHYDPAIAAPMRETEPVDADLWPIYRAIRCPVMAIRGGKSQLFPADLLQKLQELGAVTHLVPEAGHVPSLHDPASQAAIARFLAG